MTVKNKWDHIIRQYAETIIRFRWPVAILSILAILAMGSGGRLIQFATNYNVFFSKSNPQLEAFEKLQAVYTKNDNVLFVLQPKDGNAFTAETMSAVEELTEESWRIPYALRVDSLTNFQHTRAEEDDLIVEDLIIDPRNRTPEEFQAAKEIALKEPILLNRLIPEKGHVTGVNVTFELPGKSLGEVPQVVNHVRQLAKDYETKYPHLKIGLTGMVMLNNAFSEASQKDLSTLVPLMYLGMIILMIFLLRSISGTIATVLVIGLATIGAMGMAGYFGVQLTPPSAQAPTIILTMAIADSIHILMTLFFKMRHGMTKNEAIVETLRVNMQPVFLTSLTTAIGFLSMNFSDTPPLWHLGNIAAAGVGLAFILSVVFLPAVMAILPVKTTSAERGEWKWLTRFSHFVTKKYKPLLWISSFTVIILTTLIPMNEINDQFVRYFHPSTAFRQDSDFAIENLSGVYMIEHSLGAGESGGIASPDYLNKLEEFTAWYKSQPGVLHVQTFSDIMKRLNKNMHGDDQAYYRIPENRELAAQYLLLYEMSLPYGLDLNNQVNVDKSATRFSVTLNDMTTKEIRALVEKSQEWLAQNAPEHMFSYGSGPSVMFSYITGRNTIGMVKGTVSALFLISFILIFAFRSLKYGLLSLIPNLVPGAMAFGLWGLLAGRINMGLSIVLGMTLGIVVDDSIHFLSKFIRAHREDKLDAPQAVHYAFASVGKALIATSIILTGGFLLLTQSLFAMNADMGKLTAITIMIALIADFFLLPAILIKFEGTKNAPTPPKETSSHDKILKTT